MYIKKKLNLTKKTKDLNEHISIALRHQPFGTLNILTIGRETFPYKYIYQTILIVAILSPNYHFPFIRTFIYMDSCKFIPNNTFIQISSTQILF